MSEPLEAGQVWSVTLNEKREELTFLLEVLGIGTCFDETANGRFFRGAKVRHLENGLEVDLPASFFKENDAVQLVAMVLPRQVECHIV